jgi:CubicO group peptidase (beta-lactamase class C family)
VCLGVVAALLLVSGACSHAPPPTETPKDVERREDWLLALRSDLERIGSNDGFEGQIRVLHAGKPEIDRTYGNASCLPLGAGRRVLATLAVAALVEDRKLGFDERLDRHLSALAKGSLGRLTVADLLTYSAGMAVTGGDSLAEQLDAAGEVPLQAAPGTRVDPNDERPWLLVERLVAEVSGTAFDRFVQERLLTRAGMTGTTLAATQACPGATPGTTTLEDQFRLVDALRSGKLVAPAIRAALWAPRLPLGPGSDVGYGFFVRTRGDERAVGITSVGAAPAYDLWINPAGADALVLLGRTPSKTARGLRTALGEFYALPPGAPHSSAPSRRPPAR